MIRAYVDSSWRDDVAGFGVYIVEGAKERIFSNTIPADNNNYGELWAVYQAAIFCACHDAVIYTDSQTAIAYIKGTVKEDKERTPEQYRRHQQMKVLAYKINRLGVRCEYVKGHKRKEYCNNLADFLARRALDNCKK